MFIPLGEELSVHPIIYAGVVQKTSASLIATVLLISISPVSYLFTVALLTPIFRPTSSCVILFCSRRDFNLEPIVTVLTSSLFSIIVLYDKIVSLSIRFEKLFLQKGLTSYAKCAII